MSEPQPCRPGGTVTTNFATSLLQSGADAAPAVVDAGGVTTYHQLRRAAGTVAAELRKLALPRDARVALLGPNSAFWTAAYAAAMTMHTVVPLADRATPSEIADQIALVGCSALMIDRRSWGRFRTSLPPTLPIITDEVLANDDTWWPETTDCSADASLMFTSGSTSRPRAVRITHANLHANTSSILRYINLRSTDRALALLPFHYSFGASILHTHLFVGASVHPCLTSAFPQSVVDQLIANRCTVLAGVPSTYEMLLKHSTFASVRIPDLRILQQAGGRLPPDRIAAVAEAQPHAQFFVMYGQTEATARLSYLPPDRVRDRADTVGIPIPGVEFTIVDENGHQVEPGVTGELMARGQNISPGYFEDDAASAERFVDGVLRTGDLARQGEDGFISIVGRTGDFVKSWGYRISCPAVEARALEVDGVEQAAAFGVPDDDAGEELHLAVVLRTAEPPSTEDLLVHLRSTLSRTWVPRHVHVLSEMPLSPNGKIQKTQLAHRVHPEGDPGEARNPEDGP